ncbi:type I methionyl aminopeptidase [Blastopirellula marina]|uniref:Methionine aminopeptidase n=1 Tax=Blastopirellula marina TaxID=124 RepID=A0A2S8FTX9_9BACT|nr:MULTISPECIES: type I methionyl aminopeptidase [Pirellulaceae]PQO35637.1 type I methionyl aminopeptidase [Blastopirellula marina]RCS53211.1 type I methionyl aminopeptidase [Bremerella cremea]
MITLRSKREIEKMHVAGQLVRQAHQKVAELVRPGVTTAELDKAVDDLFAEAGAIPLFKGVPGKVPFPAATCVSVNDEVVHGIPGKRILKEGDIVSVDTGAKIGGWCGDSAWTYAVGEISDEAKKLMEVTERALHVAIELLPVKKRWSQVAKEMQNVVESAGFSVITTLVGHGIGTTMHEEPQVPNYDSREFRQKGDFDLRPGLVIAVEPMVAVGREDLYLHGDGWTLSTKDHSLTAHFEHTLALTTSGVRILTGDD